MKRITIIEDEWGPGRLLRSADGKKCCLGFACLALGKTKEEIIDRAYPSSVGISLFVNNIGSEKLREMARAARAKGNSIEAIASNANDVYHETGDPDRRAKLIEVMRQAFREAGLVFVLKRGKP